MDNFSDMFQHFIKNPEMIKQSLEMLQSNPAMMEQFKSMSKSVQDNPDLLNNLMGEKPKPILKFEINEYVITKNLKNNDYNDLEGIVESYNDETKRYCVNIPHLNKKVSLKEENLEIKIDESIPIEIE